MILFNRNTPRSLVAAAALFAASAAAPEAHAISDKERWAAHEHLTQAQDLKKKGQLQEALSHFEESQRLNPKLKTLMELADCAEQLGKLVEAKTHWAAARDRAAQEELPQSRQRAEERLAAVEKRVPQLTLQPASDMPADAQIYFNDLPVERTSLGTAMAANPGDYVVVVKAAGHDDAKYELKLAEGDSRTLPVAAGPKTAPEAPPPPPPPPPQVAKPVEQEARLSTDSGSTRRTLGIVVGSVGIVGLGAGGVFWSLGFRDRSRLGPTSDRNMLIGQISVISGGALLATGIVLFATAPSDNAKEARLPVVPTLSIARDSTLLGAAGEF